MDQRGSLVDTSLKIYPSEKLIAFIKTIPTSEDIPLNVLRYIKDNVDVSKIKEKKNINVATVQFTNIDIELINKLKNVDTTDVVINNSRETEAEKNYLSQSNIDENLGSQGDNELKNNESIDDCDSENSNDKLYLTTFDIDWLYAYMNVKKSKGDENVPYLHELFQGTEIAMPENRVIKRNPVLEARCVKLRAQQEAREYRKMTKGVDNVRMRFPEDSISYQLKQLNRQLIAIGQFIISIFAGFLFGFRGVEWMVGNLDFGVRLLLGVMCALIIALAEIYFLAKKLNEELTMSETVQLGGPPKFANQPENRIFNSPASDKEHQD